MKDCRKIHEILQLEDTDEILSFKTDKGLLIWPALRYLIFRQLYNEKFGLAAIGPKQRFAIKDVTKLIILFVTHNPLKILFNRKIVNLFVYSSVSNFKDGNNYTNRVADYFFLLQQHNSYCLETLYNKELNRPRTHDKVVYALALNAVTKLLVKSKIIRNSNEETRRVLELISLLDKRSEARFSKQLQILSNKALDALALAKSQFVVYNLFFKLSSIKNLILEDAAYGGNSFIQYAAKKNNITIIEPQHGALTEEHLGYNFGECVSRSEVYKKYLPDYFLSYGRYWIEQVNLPVRMVPIGNPYLSEYLKRVKLNENLSSKSILVISPGTTREETEFVTSSLARHLKDYVIKLRPHPLEKFEALEKYKSLIDIGVVLDTTPKVYDSIVQADCIIGDISTVLFEAVAFKKIVISYKSKINPPARFPQNLVHVTELQNLVETTEGLLNRGSAVSDTDLSYVWETDWEQNFKSFLYKLEN